MRSPGSFKRFHLTPRKPSKQAGFIGVASLDGTKGAAYR